MSRVSVLSILFLFVVLQSVSGQLTIGPLETHFMASFFESSLENPFSRITEVNEDMQVTREWILNDEGKLIRELDYRESGFSSSMNGEYFGSGLSNYKEYLFKYDTENKIAEVFKTLVLNGDTLKMRTEFSRSAATEVKKTSTMLMDGKVKKDFIATTYLSNGRKDSIQDVLITHGGGMEFETRTKTVFLYDDQGNLKQEQYYFSVSDTFERGEKGGETMYRMTAKFNYGYDTFGRLKEIEHLGINEKGTPVLDSRTIYKYLKESNKIQYVEFKYGESADSESVELLLEYNAEGNLFRIKSDFGVVQYKFEKRS